MYIFRLISFTFILLFINKSTNILFSTEWMRYMFKQIINVFLSNCMIGRRMLKIWRFPNVSHEQKFPLILIIFCILHFRFYFARIIWDNCLVKPTVMKTFCQFHTILNFNSTESFRYKSLEMTFERGPLLPQNYTILKKRRQTLKVHDRNKKR